MAAWQAELALPALSPAAEVTWQAFARLSARRAGGFGPAPLQWSEIRAFQDVTGIRLAPWQIEAIEVLDRLFLVEHSAARKRGSHHD